MTGETNPDPSAAPEAAGPMPDAAPRRFLVPQKRLSLADQWQRLVALIEATGAAAANALRFHESARAEIEASAALLDQTLEELRQAFGLPDTAPAPVLVHAGMPAGLEVARTLPRAA